MAFFFFASGRKLNGVWFYLYMCEVQHNAMLGVLWRYVETLNSLADQNRLQYKDFFSFFWTLTPEKEKFARKFETRKIFFKI